jgi:ABC-type antimicrobial peptide transport system permease subunit
VSQRTNEFGVRTALGARASQLVGLVLREAFVLGVVGVLIGTAGALFAANALEKIVFGVSARDALVFALAPGIVLLCALAATLVPALRAARVQPLIAIRDG